MLFEIEYDRSSWPWRNTYRSRRAILRHSPRPPLRNYGSMMIICIFPVRRPTQDPGTRPKAQARYLTIQVNCQICFDRLFHFALLLDGAYLRLWHMRIKFDLPNVFRSSNHDIFLSGSTLGLYTIQMVGRLVLEVHCDLVCTGRYTRMFV